MSAETSAAAVALRPPFPAPSPIDTAAGERVPVHGGTIAIARTRSPRGGRLLVSALGDILGLVGVAYAFPLVILAVGIPIALLVRLVLWMIGAL